MDKIAPKMKEIEFFKSSLSSGGAEHQLTILANFLSEIGYSVTITTFLDLEDHYRISEHIHRIQLAKGKSQWKKIFAIWRHMIRCKSSAIIGFGVRENCLMLPPLFFNRKPIVIAGERNSKVSKPVWFEYLDWNLLYKRAKFIVPNSETQEKYLIKNYPKLRNKIRTITNYTDLRQYTSTPMKIEQECRIGVFCRYEKQKNLHGFIKALALLKDRTSKSFHVDWYGNKQFANQSLYEYYADAEQLIKENCLEGYISLNGSIRNVADTIPKYEVLCLPSFFEGFSNSISEYICCGRPVLCSNVSDNSVMVRDGINGYLFNPESVESIASALLKYMELTSEAKIQMGIESRSIAEELFDKERFLTRYTELIES